MSFKLKMIITDDYEALRMAYATKGYSQSVADHKIRLRATLNHRKWIAEQNMKCRCATQWDSWGHDLIAEYTFTNVGEATLFKLFFS